MGTVRFKLRRLRNWRPFGLDWEVTASECFLACPGLIERVLVCLLDSNFEFKWDASA